MSSDPRDRLEIEERVTVDPSIVVPDEIEERLADEDDEDDELLDLDSDS